MVSDFRKKKLLHVYKAFFDTDRSGVVDKEDMDYSVESVGQARKWTADNPKRKEFESIVSQMWEELRKEADTDGDGKLSEDEWIALWDQYSKNPNTAREWQNLFCKMTFTLQDEAGDGVIDAEEFASTYVIFGLNKQKSLESFKKMSSGKDTITYPEFQKLFNEYFLSEDPNAPGNYVFSEKVCLVKHNHGGSCTH